MSNPSKDHFFTLDRAVDRLLKDTPFILQVGANDGVKYDPVHPYITAHKWPGLLVEPLPDAVEKLQKNYKGHTGLQFANVAVADHDGTITMSRVAPAQEGEVGEWASYIAEVKGHAAPKNLSTRPEVAPHMIDFEVPARTLKTLVEEHGVSKIDIVQVDTEGYDYQVLRQIDFEQFHPSVIHFEYGQLPPEEQQAVKDLLTDNGYVFALTNLKDMLAVPKNRLGELISDEELAPYTKYIDSGDIKNKDDLIYALALLCQIASCFTSTAPVNSRRPLRDTTNYSDVIRDSGGLRNRNIPEALDAIDRMTSLFKDKAACLSFLDSELPQMTVRAPTIAAVVNRAP